MDRDSKKSRFSWLPAEMPGVARRIASLRAELGEAHVAECWDRGFIKREPGWFYAREGAIAIGTSWADPELGEWALFNVTPDQALVVLRPKEVTSGAH